MNKFKNLIYFISVFPTLNLNSSFSKESNNNFGFFKESREIPSEDGDWVVTAISLELFPQDDSSNQEQASPKIDSSSDEPNFSDD